MRYRPDVITANSIDDLRGVASYASTMTVVFDLEAPFNVITGKCMEDSGITVARNET